MMNSVNLIGRLTRDPELKTTPSGKSVCSFTLAIDKDSKGQDGELNADFPQVIAWNQKAEYLCQYGYQGARVSVNGSIQTRNYDDQNGKKVYITEILARKLTVIDYKKNNTSEDHDKNDYLNGGKSIRRDELDKEIAENPPYDDLPF